MAEKWDDLGEGAHIGVYVGAAAAAAIAVAAFGWWCSRQRKAGRLQRALDDSAAGQSGAELAQMQNQKPEWRQSQWGQQSYQRVP